MIVMSDSTTLIASSSDAKTGRSSVKGRGTPGGGGPAPIRSPNIRPNNTKIPIGSSVPKTPSGSRTKILISSHASFQSPRIITSARSISNRVSGQLEEHVLERLVRRPQIDHADSVLRHAVDHLRHEIASHAANRQLLPLAAHRLYLRERAKAIGGRRVPGRHDDGPLGTVALHQRRRRADVDDAAVIDDGDAVAEALGLLHQVRGQEHRLASLTDAADQF